MRNKVVEYINKHKMLIRGDGILVGVSGGPDSICLLHILKSIQKEYSLQVMAVHINHQLRGKQADKDEKYVLDLCLQWDIPCFAYKIDIEGLSQQKGVSIEEAGREARYEKYFELKKQYNLQKIALGQHRDDNAETILMRILRGTGPEGLKGIPPHREDGVIRPLLAITRKEIEEYCGVHHLSPCIDQSNLQPIYLRNKLRLEVIPYLEKFNSNFRENLNHLGEIIGEQQDFVDHAVEELWNGHREFVQDGVAFSTDWFEGLSPFIKKQMLRRGIKWVKNDLKEIEFTHIQMIVKMLENDENTTWTLDLPGEIIAKRQYEKIMLLRRKKNQVKDFEYSLPINTEIPIEEVNKTFKSYFVKREEVGIIKDTSYKKYFDMDKLQATPIIRNRRPGDKFFPIGLRGSKKLKEYFIDLKIPRDQRDSIPIVVVNQEILWIVGHRVDRRYIVDQTTKNILVIEYFKIREEQHGK